MLLLISRGAVTAGFTEGRRIGWTKIRIYHDSER